MGLFRYYRLRPTNPKLTVFIILHLQPPYALASVVRHGSPVPYTLALGINHDPNLP